MTSDKATQMPGLSEFETMLCRLSDPDYPPIELAGADIAAIVAAGRAHGVGPILHRKLRSYADHDAVKALRSEVETLAGMTMLLQRIAATFGEAIAAASLPAAIIKGPVFTRHLYRHPSDRPFTDIDILAAPAAMDDLTSLLRSLGYERHRKVLFDRSSANEEQKWVNPELPTVLIELHGNLVHYPMLRRRVGFGYAELMRVDARNPESPLSLFLVAVVHAALGHKFHELKLLVDVLQAFRNLGESDRHSLVPVAAGLGLGLEIGLCLDLIGELFGQEDARRLARSLAKPPVSGLARRMVDAGTVLSAPDSTLSLIRRRLFRLLQHLPRS